MAIGKYCQLCGEKKRKNEVIGEAQGIVVTAPCLMSKVFGDPPADPALVAKMVKFCAVCGTEQPEPLPEHCVSCGAALTASVAAADLAAAGEPAPPRTRALAFVVDLVIIALLSALVIMGISRIESWSGADAAKLKAEDAARVENISAPAKTGEEAPPAPEVKTMSVFTLLRYAGVLFIFIFYHAVLTALGGATIGKRILEIRVVLKNGSPRVDFLRALTRSALYLFTIYVVPIGFLPLVFQERPEEWLGLIERDAMFHNSLTDTTVIKSK